MHFEILMKWYEVVAIFFFLLLFDARIYVRHINCDADVIAIALKLFTWVRGVDPFDVRT